MPKQQTGHKTEPKSLFAIRIGVSRGRVSQLASEGLPLAPTGEVRIDAAMMWLAVRRSTLANPSSPPILGALAAEIGCRPEDLRNALRRLVADHAG